MRVLFLSDEGGGGGASIAAGRLAEALDRDGQEIHLAYRRRPPGAAGGYRSMTQLKTRSPVLSRMRAVWHSEFARRLAMRSWLQSLERLLERLTPDLVHVHNLHAAGWDIELVQLCLRHAPVVWTLHDLWAVTGSCAHPLDCRRFLSECDASCPQVGVYPTLPAGMIAAAFARRQELFRARQALVLVSPSTWLAELARPAVPEHVPILQVPNWLDLERFRPDSGSGDALRQGPSVVLAAAADLSAYHKGLDLLLDAVRSLAQPIRLQLMGDASRLPAGKLSLPPEVQVEWLGYAQTDLELIAFYRGADLLVHPARADNEPLVVTEAMACGLPVVGFQIGGVPELVGDTGWLADRPEGEALAEQLLRALERPQQLARRGGEARQRMVARLSPAATRERYLEIYAEIVGTHRAGRRGESGKP